MINKDKLIEAIATPIHEGNSCTDWESAKKMAEAALIALCRELPEARVEDSPHTNIMKGYDLYSQLKDIGKEE